MKVSITKSDLKEALATVSKAVNPKAEIPIQSGVYLNAHNSQLELQTTGTPYAIKCAIPANVIDDGTSVVNCSVFISAIDKLSDIITFESDDNALTFKSDAVQGNLNVFNANDFPLMQTPTDTKSFQIHAKALKDIKNNVAFSASQDISRPMFKGVLFDIAENKLTAAATDARQLSSFQVNVDNDNDDFQIIIPAPTINLLASFKVDDKITLSYNTNTLHVNIGNYQIQSRLIDGIYPNYKKVRDDAFNNAAIHIDIPTAKFIDAVEKVAFISNVDENKCIKFEVTGNKLNVAARVPVYGEVSVPCECTSHTGADVKIAFNINFIRSYLNSVKDSKMLHIHIEKELAPIVIIADNNDSYKYIVTPLRIRW